MDKEPIIALELPLGAVNFILQVLAEQPYSRVKGLMDDLTKQANAALSATPLPPIDKA
jgi:hypothetical protein